MNRNRQPHIVIIGGGFGGLYATRSLRRAPVRITLIDRSNHHLFQPLLYEVATAALSPADIAAPIRKLFARDEQIRVLMAEVSAIDPERRRVHLDNGSLEYDYLIVAAGATHSYFNHDDWAAVAPGLKTVDDALEIRRRFLLAFERAERETDEKVRAAQLTFVVVGAGPTGVELAGTMSELARRAIPLDFRNVDTTTARVILVEGRDRVLPTFDPQLSQRALRDLQALGVEVRLNSLVTDINARGVRIGEEQIDAENVIWAAGVQASPLAACFDAERDANGRLQVDVDLSVPGHPEVFVIGDMARVTARETGEMVPGIAPAAIQMGKYVAKLIRSEVAGKSQPNQRQPFRFKDRGMLATIGRGKAVGSIQGRRVVGVFAWLIWALVHIVYLIGFANRLVVMLRWIWAYVVFRRGARLITGDVKAALARPQQRTGSEPDNAQPRATHAVAEEHHDPKRVDL